MMIENIVDSTKPTIELENEQNMTTTLPNRPSTNSSKVNIATEQETENSSVHKPIKQVTNGVYVNYHDEKPHKKGSGVFFISTEADSSVSVDYHQDIFHSNINKCIASYLPLSSTNKVLFEKILTIPDKHLYSETQHQEGAKQHLTTALYMMNTPYSTTLYLDSDFITCNSTYYQSLLDSFSKSNYDMLVFIDEDTQIIDSRAILYKWNIRTQEVLKEWSYSIVSHDVYTDKFDELLSDAISKALIDQRLKIIYHNINSISMCK